MANLFGFGTYGCILGHQIRIHIECNTFFSFFDWAIQYNEAGNQIRVILELFKISFYFSVSSNCQDCWNDSEQSYFLHQDHMDMSQIPQHFKDMNEQMATFEQGEVFE